MSARMRFTCCRTAPAAHRSAAPAEFISKSIERTLVSIPLFTLLCILILGTFSCSDRNSASAGKWDRIVNGENNEHYYIDRKAIERVSENVVRITVKYAPTKGRFLVSLQELSKEFGSQGQDIGQEYTISQWEFNCEKSEGRCLNLTHFRKGTKVAAYDYGDSAAWTTLQNAPGTKVLRDLVCTEASRSAP